MPKPPTRLAQLVERLHTEACPHGLLKFYCRPCLVAAFEAVVREDANIAKENAAVYTERAIRTRWGLG